jgi:hypothetical protein
MSTFTHHAGLPGGVRRAYVETGLYSGDSLAEALKHPYEQIIGIEAHPAWARHCGKRFAGDPRVRVFEGHSPDVLRDLVVPAPATFFLDAHYTGHGRELQHGSECPLLSELLWIPWAQTPLVVIDDAAMFTEAFWDTEWSRRFDRIQWPTLGMIQDRLPPHYTMRRHEDLLVCLPAGSW